MTAGGDRATLRVVTVSGGPHLTRVHDALDQLAAAAAEQLEATRAELVTAEGGADTPVKQLPAPPAQPYGR